MKIQVLFVCSDPVFPELFATYAGGSQHDFSILCFTDPEKGFSYWQNNRERIQVLLSDKAFLTRCAPNTALSICLADFTKQSENEGELQYLNAYQPRRDILADLQLIMQAKLTIPQWRVKKGHSSVISFFSTQGGSGKSTLAYLTALRAAHDGKVAYVTLEPAPFEEWLYPQPQFPISGEEFLYGIRDRQDPAKGILPDYGQGRGSGHRIGG